MSRFARVIPRGRGSARVVVVAILAFGASQAVAGAMGWEAVLVGSSDSDESRVALPGDGSIGEDASTPEPTVPGEAPTTVSTDGEVPRDDAPGSPARILDVEAPASLQPGDDLVVRWRVSSPVEVETWMKVGGANGWVDWCGFPTRGVPSGAEGDVVYEARCALPETLPNGVLTVFIDAIDVALGNEVQVEVVVVGGSEDDDAPVVSDVEIDASASGPGGTIRVTWRATDETGTAGVMPWVVGPNGFMVDDASRPWATFPVGTLETGTSTDGTYSAVVRLSDTAVPGSYWIWFSARDVLGNRFADFTPAARFSLR